MFAISGIVVLFSASVVRSSFIDVQEDRLVSIDPEESFVLNETQRKNSRWEVGEDRSIDSKDMLLPVLAGVVLKTFSVAPLLFALVGWLAGLGLAAGKVALVLSGGLALCYYFSQYNPLVPPVPVANHLGWEHSIGEAGLPTHSEFSSQLYQPQQHEELHQRDRAMHLPTAYVTK